MYAIIETGGKQYKVESGDVIDIEKLDAQLMKKSPLTRLLLYATESSKWANRTLRTLSLRALYLRTVKVRR